MTNHWMSAPSCHARYDASYRICALLWPASLCRSCSCHVAVQRSLASTHPIVEAVDCRACENVV
eukprot:544354-Pleurochrysis_carterae.AAC.1